MKLVVAVNHAVPFHVGGSERVVQQITESMTHDFGIECHVLARYAGKKVCHNGVTVEKTADSELGFLAQVNAIRPDHLHVYSDSFCYWPVVVRRSEDIKATKSVALVGMNYMRTHQDLLRVFRTKHQQFKIITHSDNYFDYSTCVSMGLPANVIPNAVDMNEFKDQGFSFREKYGIVTEKMILCVSNFFPGKGQEHLDHILRRLAEKRKDFTAVFICTTVNFQPANALRARHAQQLAKKFYPSKLLVDIPRADTLQAFREADVFAFPSQTEVAPLVILEAMAAGLPWVALNVGNVPTLDGGFVISGEKMSQGKWNYTTDTYDSFLERLDALLSDSVLRAEKGEAGRSLALKRFDWAQVRRLYHQIFSGREVEHGISAR